MERKIARDIALDALNKIAKDREPTEVLGLAVEVAGILLKEGEELTLRMGETARNRMATGGRNRGAH